VDGRLRGHDELASGGVAYVVSSRAGQLA
jgi:hypothetical protein